VPTITLVTGGARSGKSRYALARAQRYEKKAFIATAEVTDEEMRSRIEKHRAERGDSFATIEVPLALAGALLRIPADCGVAVVDCLTVWLGNLMHRHGTTESLAEVDAFLAALGECACDLIIVTNELGMGVVPDNAMAREFRDSAGRLNQRMAAVADEVVLLVSGVPLVVKGAGAR
jgi:adenosylcobinamide kinase/adenosylcobinamide-phosphate guanylyltransferase